MSPRTRKNSRSLRLESLEQRCLLHGGALGSFDKLHSSPGHHSAGIVAASEAATMPRGTASASVSETEPPSVKGQNDMQPGAQFFPTFGTGPGDQAAIDVTGALSPAPVLVPVHEDDGSIPLANDSGLVAGQKGRATVTAIIGDGPNGSSGTRTGDYDYYRVPTLANQLLTVNVDVSGSTLNSVVAIYNSSGTRLALNDDKYDNPFYGFSRGSYLRFLASSDGAYYVAVFGSGGGVVSEGAYSVSIVLESPSIIAPAEDNGSIPSATSTGLTLGPGGTAYYSAEIGDGPRGSAGTGTGDFDFYRVPATSGQRIIVDVDGTDPDATWGLDTYVGLYTSTGDVVALNDDDGQTTNSYFSFVAPDNDTYYVVIGGFNFLGGEQLPTNPFDPASGPGIGVEGVYTLEIQVVPLEAADVDYYSFDLAAGDIFGANVSGGAGALRLFRPDGTLLIGSEQGELGLYPEASPLPKGGNADLASVISTPGRYSLAVVGGETFEAPGVGRYALQLRDSRPALEQQPVGSHQILFLDFNGANVNVPEAIPYLGDGFPDAHLSPLSAFLPRWRLTPADENAVINAIVTQVTNNLAHQVSGVVGRGLNGDFTVTGHAGDFQIEVLNSRDNPDSWGLYPNVSRVIVGGTLDEMGVHSVFGGISSSIDIGNFDTAETAFALVGRRSDPPIGDPLNDPSINAVPLAPGRTIIDLVGYYMGYLVAHEAGHFFGNWHVDSTSTNIMNATLFPIDVAGHDGVWGTADDLNLEYKTDSYRLSEGYTGVEDTLNTIAFGLSTGKQAGTYFDFVTGTLYVSGSIDDGHSDALRVKTVGTNLQIYINGQLSLTRPTAGVNRVVLNGSSDGDLLDASAYQAVVTLQGKSGNDVLMGGTSNDLLFGGDGDDLLFGGPGNDVLVGGDGSDALDGGLGSDLLIGGRGSDILLGTSGGDLLIAGRTTFDNNTTALLALLSEWSSARTYEKRLANLRGTGSGSRANGNNFLKTSGPQATVFDDDASDLLYGGSDRDWYFATRTGKNKDLIVGLANNESIDG